MNIRDKVIVITGASSGIGREAAIHLSRHGADVVLVARSPERMAKVQAEVRQIANREPLAVPCDITVEDDVARMASVVRERCSRVDVLINSAGIGRYLPSEMLSNREMRDHFAVNFFGAYYCIKALLPLMKQTGTGYILNVGSVFGRWVPFPDVSVYAASKFALRGFSEGLRRELKPYGIGVGLLMPAAVNTPFQDKKMEGERKAPPFLMLEPASVARTMEAMIVHEKKNVVLPRWIAPLFWLRPLL